MAELTRNEMITLKHLTDGQNHTDTPNGLTDAQFHTALNSLKEKKMVIVSFLTNGTLIMSKILEPGCAAMDDMKLVEKRLLIRILRTRNFILSQYELLKYTQLHDISHTSEQFSQEIFKLNKNDFKTHVWKKLYDEGYLQTDTKKTGLILTPMGVQLIEEIEEELYWQLSNESKVSEGQISDNGKHKEAESKVSAMLKYCSDPEKCATILQMLSSCNTVNALKAALINIDADGSMIDMCEMDSIDFCRDIIPLIGYKTNDSALKQVIHRLNTR